MIDRVNVNAESAGISDRLETIVKDMKELTFPAYSFDGVGSEGAIYNLGFEVGLEKLLEIIKRTGY